MAPVPPASQSGSTIPWARPSQRAVFVSDLHIRRWDDAPATAFLTFLQRLDPGVDLVILGDLFDWLYGASGWVPGPLRPVIEALTSRQRVLWLEGNHDMRVAAVVAGGPVRVSAGPLRLSVGGLRLDLRHGDLVDPRDRGYRVLRRFLRSPVMWGITRALRPGPTQRLGELATSARRLGTVPRDWDGRKRSWLDAARRQAEGLGGVDLALRGHGHWLGWWGEGLICLGDWLHYRSYLEVDPDGARLRRFEPSGDDPVLAEGPLGALPW